MRVTSTPEKRTPETVLSRDERKKAAHFVMIVQLFSLSSCLFSLFSSFFIFKKRHRVKKSNARFFQKEPGF